MYSIPLLVVCLLVFFKAPYNLELLWVLLIAFLTFSLMASRLIKNVKYEKKYVYLSIISILFIPVGWVLTLLFFFIFMSIIPFIYIPLVLSAILYAILCVVLLEVLGRFIRKYRN